MRRAWSGPGLALLLALAPRPACADGKLYFTLPDLAGKEPFQRAAIVHEAGTEWLMIQPQHRGPAREFGWVVPVPTEPKLQSMDFERAFHHFWHLARLARPHYRRYGWAVELGFLLLAYLVAFWAWRKGRGARIWAVVFFLASSLWYFPSVLFTSRSMGTSQVGSDDGVTVLSSQRLGIYDAKVLRSNEPGSIQAWLTDRGFQFGPEDSQVFRSYEERGWCFVASRIASSAKVRETHDGLLDALLLQFSCPEPVYPFALTATQPEATELALYVIAAHRVAHPALATLFAGPVAAGAAVDIYEWAALPQSPGFLTKLRGKLSRQNCPGDVELRPAVDDSDYRETLWVW